MIRLDRHTDRAIIETARERDVDLMILGWPGHSGSAQHAFGSVIDLAAENPPCDLAVVRFRKRREPRRILVPTAGGANTRLAISLAIDQARRFSERTGEEAEVTLLNICLPATAGPDAQARSYELLRNLSSAYKHRFEVKVVSADDVVEGIVKEATNHDLVIIGATDEGLFEQVLFGTIPERVTLRAPVTVMMVKRYRGPVRSWLRRTFSWLFALGERRRARQKP
jgi:nucleotide-binding universal stress UspA family protein